MSELLVGGRVPTDKFRYLHAGDDMTGPGPNGLPSFRRDPADALTEAACRADSRLAMADKGVA